MNNELHNAIMNLLCDPKQSAHMKDRELIAYKIGHRDARHAAAELVANAEADVASRCRAQGGNTYPDCGACPGDGSICATTCRAADESPVAASPVTPESQTTPDLPPLPEMVSIADIDYAKDTPADWDADYKRMWGNVQVESRNKLAWRAHALELRARLAVQVARPLPALTVWCSSMPESNGKSNFTAILMRKDAEGMAKFEGFTIARSEYPDRVRYEADCVRHLIGELENEPFILDYDADKHSGYVEPAAVGALPAPAAQSENMSELFKAALEVDYPIPDSPHASVIQRALDDRVAFWAGWSARARATDELAGAALPAPVVATDPETAWVALLDSANAYLALDADPCIGIGLADKQTHLVLGTKAQIAVMYSGKSGAQLAGAVEVARQPDEPSYRVREQRNRLMKLIHDAALTVGVITKPMQLDAQQLINLMPQLVRLATLGKAHAASMIPPSSQAAPTEAEKE